MGNRKAIQIVIPTPCHESWEEMTPVDGGRHCAHCNKRVIDFTQSSDEELYNAVTSANGELCGRLLTTQINRPISIPYQPHSRLYRIAIAMGLGLIFTQSPQVLAQNSPPLVQDSLIFGKPKANDSLNSKTSGGISGRVIDETKQGIVNAIVQVFKNNTLVGGNVTDYDGNFIVTPIQSGNYNIIITSMGYDSLIINNIQVESANFRIDKAIEMKIDPNLRLHVQGLLRSYNPTLLPDPPTKRTFSRTEINRNW